MQGFPHEYRGCSTPPNLVETSRRIRRYLFVEFESRCRCRCRCCCHVAVQIRSVCSKARTRFRRWSARGCHVGVRIRLMCSKHGVICSALHGPTYSVEYKASANVRCHRHEEMKSEVQERERESCGIREPRQKGRVAVGPSSLQQTERLADWAYLEHRGCRGCVEA